MLRVRTSGQSASRILAPIVISGLKPNLRAVDAREMGYALFLLITVGPTKSHAGTVVTARIPKRGSVVPVAIKRTRPR
jgi:hypothetical protein